MVGKEGLEPSRFIQPTDFKSVAYTNSATRPFYGCTFSILKLCFEMKGGITMALQAVLLLVRKTAARPLVNSDVEARTRVELVYEVLQTSA